MGAVYHCIGPCVHHGTGLRSISSLGSGARLRLPAAVFGVTLVRTEPEAEEDVELGASDAPLTRLRTTLSGSSFDVSESASDTFPSSPGAGVGAGVDQAGAERRNEQEASSCRSAAVFSFSLPLPLSLFVAPFRVVFALDVTTVLVEA